MTGGRGLLHGSSWLSAWSKREIVAALQNIAQHCSMCVSQAKHRKAVECVSTEQAPKGQGVALSQPCHKHHAQACEECCARHEAAIAKPIGWSHECELWA
jgi:hypothetical protein